MLDALLILAAHWPWFLLLGVTATFELCPGCCAYCTYTNASLAISGVSPDCPTECTPFLGAGGAWFKVTDLDLNGLYDLGTAGSIVLENAMTITTYLDEDCTVEGATDVKCDIAINLSCSESDPHFTVQVIAFLHDTVVVVYEFFNSAGFNPGDPVAGAGECGGSLTLSIE